MLAKWGWGLDLGDKSMKTLASTLAALGLVALLAGAAYAQSDEAVCTTDADCAAGEFCAIAPCAAPACDPDDPDCVPFDCPTTGVCSSTGGGDHGGMSGWGDCETDADCGDGLTCDVVGGMSCACPDGQSCPECDEPVEIKGCVPAPCTTAADCGAGQVCMTVSYDDCTDSGGFAPGAPCRPDEPCDPPMPPPEPTCETKTESFCAPKYVAPCTTATDCGEGFTCEPAEVCECSGGGSVPPAVPTDPADPSRPDPAEPPPSDESQQEEDCTCTPTGLNYCKPVETKCTADADCPAEWTCMEEPQPGVPCTSTPGGEPDCPEPPPAESYCVPPGFGSWAGGGSSTDPGGYNDVAEAVTGGEGATLQELTPEQRGAFTSTTDPSDACASTEPSGLMWLALALLGLVALRRREDAPSA